VVLYPSIVGYTNVSHDDVGRAGIGRTGIAYNGVCLTLSLATTAIMRNNIVCNGIGCVDAICINHTTAALIVAILLPVAPGPASIRRATAAVLAVAAYGLLFYLFNFIGLIQSCLTGD
jgi:hypothetical protein